MAAIDDLRALQQTMVGRSTMLDPALGSLTGAAGGATDVFKNAFANQNTATGLSPEAMSALRTQGTSGINDQYQSAAQALNSALLRRGAVGQGALPGSGGDISRAYQPLYTAMEAAKTKAQTDTILADEAAKRQSLYQNQQLAQNAANSLFGNTASLFNASNAPLNSAAQVSNSIADLETPNLLKLLGTSALTSALGGGIGGTGGGGSLLSGTGTNGSGRFGVLGDALGAITGQGSGGSTDLNGILQGISAGSYGGTAPFAGSVLEQAGQAAASSAPQLATDYGQIAKDIAGYGGSVAAPVAIDAAVGSTGATGLAGALGLGGGSGVLGLGALTIPVIGAAALGIGLLAKHYFGNGPDRMAANQLTGPGGVHEFFNEASNKINSMPDGPEKDSAINTRDRAFEQALLGFSKIDKDHYYQAKQTLRQFSGFSTVKPLLG